MRSFVWIVFWLHTLNVLCMDQDEEEFYVCKWSINESTGAPLLLLAGKKGVLRIIDCKEEKLVEVGKHLCGEQRS